MVLEALAVLVGTLLVGNELAVAAFIHPSLWRIDDLSHRRVAREIATTLGRWAPPLYAASTLCIGAAAWLNHSTALWVAAGAWVLASIFSAVFPAPLNARIATWAPENPPEDWQAMRHRWDRWHLGRTLWLLAAQALFVFALIR